MYIRTCWQCEHFGSRFFKEYQNEISRCCFCHYVVKFGLFCLQSMFFIESNWTFQLLNNFKATIMLCFQVRIFLFVLTLFNILRSFLVTVVYRFQDKGKTLGLCSAQAIEVFTSTGVSGLRNLLKKERFRAPKNFIFNNNFDTTWGKLGDNLETTLWSPSDYHPHNQPLLLIHLGQLGNRFETTWK